jgi:hypothetical protein
MFYKIPLLLSPQPEGGFAVTSPLLPELVSEGDTLDEALANGETHLPPLSRPMKTLAERYLPIQD